MSLFDRLRGTQSPADIRDEVIALADAERRKRAQPAVEQFEKIGFRGIGVRESRRWRAAALAFVGTATARKIVPRFWSVGWAARDDRGFADDVYAVCAARGAKFVETLVRGLLQAEGSGAWPLVRRAVREGLIAPPDGTEYIRQLVVDVSYAEAAVSEIEATYKGLLADPDLLDREVWQVFEVDVGAELTGASTWQPKDDGKPWEGYTRGDNRWLYALTRLADEERLDRQRLLDASLDALTRDFRATTVGWYIKLHEELEPTHAERLTRLDRYVALIASPAPVVVRAGLSAVRQLEDDVDPRAVAGVAATPFTQRQKNLATETLSLLARLCKKHPDARPTLLEAAMHALGHERPDVQERAVKLLETHPGDIPRESLLQYVEAVSPTLRGRVDALTGVSTAGESAPEIVVTAPTQPRLTRELVLDSRTPIEPVGSMDELIEISAMLVEGQGSGDDCERFLDGISRFCAEEPAGFQRRVAPLVKRAESLDTWGMDKAAAGIVGYVLRAWAGRRARGSVASSASLLGFLGARAEEVARRAARGNARPLFALPTHSGGWIDPEVLEERERGSGRVFDRPDAHDRLQARLRAYPAIGPIEYERRVHTSSRWGRTDSAVRFSASDVPTELGALTAAVAAGGAVLTDDDVWFFSGAGWGGFDVLGVRWALTVLPGLPEVAFAGSAMAAVAGRDAASYNHPEVVLAHAVDATVPLRREAWLATAACLVAKSPDLPRAAVDLLVASIEDGRFDAVGLGDATAWLVNADFATVSRLEAPLRDVARVSPLHAAQVVRAVEATLARLEAPAHGLHTVLGVAVEGSAASGQRIEDEQARTMLAGIAAESSKSSKLGKLARALLAT